ncbi:MAG: hypothetical protein K9H61_09170 [Bacteroidia bacterium]|nr:hypothetical protein [Bacteroidia bacterium]MCF8427536.1 hypothetical protein [Bacteroidia bacterium]MCF8447151.1 hypothetical protein [Bacteroidia bacterium]
MKKIGTALILFSLFLFGCQPDSTDEPTLTVPGSIDFVGTWNRDTVIVNDVTASGLIVRLETEVNFGTYIFNSDLKTGIMNHSASDFAITWNYTASQNKIVISELDWIGQSYSIVKLSEKKLKLTGYLVTGTDTKNERIIYLTKK